MKTCLNWQVLKTHQENSIKVVLNLLLLSTGASVKEVESWRWEDILESGSEGEVEVKDKLYYRRFANPIHIVVRDKITECYISLNYPKLNSQIFQSNLGNFDEFMVWMFYISVPRDILDLTLNTPKFRNPDFIRECYKISFGRKVIVECGFTKSVSQALRRHYKLSSNKEILELLKLDEKDTKIQLTKINLFAKSQMVKMENKNFDNGKNFQKFSTLNNFFAENYAGFQKPLSSSVKVLTWLSLLSGIKMSALLKLKTSDVIGINDKSGSNSNPEIVFKDLKLYLNNDFINFLKVHFSEHNLGSDSPLFITNKKNQLVSSSLVRELKNGLELIGHKHWDKFNNETPLIIWGRRILEIKGDHGPTIKALKNHFKLKSKKELLDFLHLTNPKRGFEFKGKFEKDIYKAIVYDL